MTEIRINCKFNMKIMNQEAYQITLYFLLIVEQMTLNAQFYHPL